MTDANAAPLVDVVLDDAGQTPVGIYNLVRRLRSADLNAKQVKKLVDAAPQTILPRLARVQAEAVKVELEALGAQVRLVPVQS